MVVGVGPSKKSRKSASTSVQSQFRLQKAHHSGQASFLSLANRHTYVDASSLTPGSSISHVVMRTHSAGYKGKTTNERLNRTAVRARIQAESEQQALRLSTMSTHEREALQAACAPFNGDVDMDDNMDIDPLDILEGKVSIDISHAGGEFIQLLSLSDDLFGPQRSKSHDYRTRRNRVENRNMAFLAQMDAMVESYMTWSHAMGEDHLSCSYNPPLDTTCQTSSQLTIMDMFYCRQVQIHHISSDRTVVASVIRHGYIPCSPLRPSIAFTIRTLQTYQTARNRCPQLSIHAFVKTLCDLYQKPFKPSISRQFSISLDLFLELRRQVHSRVMAALNRDAPDWRLRNACVACTYTLRDEKRLKFSMLYTVDGNDSLKRIARRETALDDQGDQEGPNPPVLGPSSESFDTRRVGHGLYLTNDQVNLLSAQKPDQEEKEDVDDENPCAERWRNMKKPLTAKMWGVFEETGIFMALCRHGSSLLMADMIRSGELSKYPIAVVAKMLDVFGDDLALGYDIGCRFSTTLSNSPIADQVKKKNHRCLVGAFHGHAHNRLCQSKNLATYVEGLGMEDLETCEQLFGESNKMAASTRHASTFHRLQTIVEFLSHRDRFHVYQNLSTFLLNKYKQALAILDTRPAVMEALKVLGADGGEVVEDWLREEEAYLTGLKREPPQETLDMEYFVLLGGLMLAEDELSQANAVFGVNVTPDTIHLPDRTQATETARRHLHETHAARLSSVQAMERKMNISERWTRDSEKWKETEKKVILRQYQRCLDTLEGLVVARMFELTKMNMSQTGYSLRKHIAAALKSRSNAIRTALTKYNAAAAALDPPRPDLTWEEVVEYAFLADFDLLRDSREDIRSRPWATPAARHAMDRYFKLLRAAEEIDRLNVEILRLWTFIRDEDAFLSSKVKEIATVNPSLAAAISAYRTDTSRFIQHHTTILNRIRQLKGYSGKGATYYGTAISSTTIGPSVRARPLQPPPPSKSPAAIEIVYLEEGEEDFEQEQAGEDEDDAALSAYTSLLRISDDSSI